MCTSYLCEVAGDVCYKWLTGNNLFVITNEGKIAQIPTPPPKKNPTRWESFDSIGVIECC